MKKQKEAFIVFVIRTLAFLAFSLFCLINLTPMLDKYPSKDELKYEECTYIKYEYVTWGYRASQYYIYVEEYNKPLKIDNIVVNKTNEELLFSLISGETITVSIEDDSKFYLFSVSYNGKYILSYEDFLSEHNSNNIVGIIVIVVMLIISCVYFSIFSWRKYLLQKNWRMFTTII